ncbi:hypothetical protein AL755_03490 (plasmid) [Arthrobacter sp. ERGS1:01]|uniref:hypothetical protein n=1 Tax=Arthrobacter sp. ERGS1:01 TaxID=1704044 RepID=UPI0006B69D98|nr:hypothetical protein [Arthrobacter sp. ERGS1:01]ALE04763.1 hypothetical protein AL755_03490 [Arthrobacter sp. ERGS1:01]
MNALRDLRGYAIRSALNETVGADVLIDTAVRALLEGVDSPSLPLLAGLLRREEGEAQELFRAVTAELNLAPPPPIDSQSTRWRLVRWLCEAIVDGSAQPEVAGKFIWDRWDELGYPKSLQPLVGWVSEWDDWHPSWDVEREHFQGLIVDEARTLLNGTWPPC